MDDNDLDTGRRSERAAFSLLRAGVPLSLLLDLAAPVPSTDLMQQERADTSWVPHAVAG
jgi:hypothetical protein